MDKQYYLNISGGFNLFLANKNKTTTNQNAINKGNGFLNANTSRFGVIIGDGFTLFNLNANGGYFVADKLALAGGLHFDMTSVDPDSENNINLNAGLRYYFLQGLFANTLLNLTKYDSSKAEFGLTIGAGYSIFMNNHTAFEPTVNFLIPFKENRATNFTIGGSFIVFF